MHKKIIILGAGISGLSLAWFLKKQRGEKCEITLIERASRPGGWICTVKEENFLFEQGPHSCRSRGNGQATLSLLEELGLARDVISPGPYASKRYILSPRGLVKAPACPISLLASPWFSGVISGLWQDWWTPAHQGGDESIDTFVTRRLGKKMAEELFDPLVTGIYAGDSKQLSVRACFPLMVKWEQEHGGLLKGMLKSKKQTSQTDSFFVKKMGKTPIFSLKNGMQGLTDTLANELSHSLRLNTYAEHLTQEGEGWIVTLNNGEQLHCNQLYGALPAHAMAALLKGTPAGDQLAALESASISIVNVGYDKPVLKMEGFGYLAQSKAHQKVLGILFDSQVFPDQNSFPGQTRLTAMVKAPSEVALSLTLQALSEILNIHAEPAVSLVTYADRAIPQYRVGHLERLASIEKNLPPNLILLGSSYRGVSVNDCIAEAERLSRSQ